MACLDDVRVLDLGAGVGDNSWRSRLRSLVPSVLLTKEIRGASETYEEVRDELRRSYAAIGIAYDKKGADKTIAVDPTMAVRSPVRGLRAAAPADTFVCSHGCGPYLFSMTTNPSGGRGGG